MIKFAIAVYSLPLFIVGQYFSVNVNFTITFYFLKPRKCLEEQSGFSLIKEIKCTSISQCFFLKLYIILLYFRKCYQSIRC